MKFSDKHSNHTPCEVVNHVFVVMLCVLHLLVSNNILETIWGFPEIWVPPNHTILVAFSVRNHPFGGTTVFGNPQMSMCVAAVPTQHESQPDLMHGKRLRFPVLDLLMP